MTYIGIDPGRTGGIVVLQDSGLIFAYPMPATNERGVYVREIVDIFRNVQDTAVIGIEWNVAHVDNVADHAFRFGLQTGQLDGIAQALNFEVIHVYPQAWMNKLGLRGKQHDPDLMYRMAWLDEHYPYAKQLVLGPRGGIQDGLLEALCITHYVKLMRITPLGKKSGPPPAKFRGLPPEEE